MTKDEIGALKLVWETSLKASKGEIPKEYISVSPNVIENTITALNELLETKGHYSFDGVEYLLCEGNKYELTDKYVKDLIKESDLINKIENSRCPSDFIDILAQHDEIPTKLKCDIIIWGLDHKDLGIRDSTIQAIELWDEYTCNLLLVDHKESEKYLREYQKQVLKDIYLG